MESIRIAVGSQNPAKIKAAIEAFRRIFGSEPEIVSVRIENTPVQPMSDEEMIEGAIYRAKMALAKTKAHYGVGMEGGVVKNRYGVFVKGWVAITDGYTIALASTVSVQLPERVWSILTEGKARELEEIMVAISNIQNIGESIGAIGYIADGRYDRIRAFRDALLCAWGRISKREIYCGEWMD